MLSQNISKMPHRIFYLQKQSASGDYAFKTTAHSFLMCYLQDSSFGKKFELAAPAFSDRLKALLARYEKFDVIAFLLLRSCANSF